MRPAAKGSSEWALQQGNWNGVQSGGSMTEGAIKHTSVRRKSTLGNGENQ